MSRVFCASLWLFLHTVWRRIYHCDSGNLSDKYGNLVNLWPSAIAAVPVPGDSPARGTYAGWVVPPITTRRHAGLSLRVSSRAATKSPAGTRFPRTILLLVWDSRGSRSGVVNLSCAAEPVFFMTAYRETRSCTRLNKVLPTLRLWIKGRARTNFRRSHIRSRIGSVRRVNSLFYESLIGK